MNNLTLRQKWDLHRLLSTRSPRSAQWQFLLASSSVPTAATEWRISRARRVDIVTEKRRADCQCSSVVHSAPDGPASNFRATRIKLGHLTR
jgi:hypothetical protein